MNVRLSSGRLIPWAAYREIMLTPRNPVAAYDEAMPARSGAAQRTAGGGDQGLSGEFRRATSKFLAEAGVSEEDIATVAEILDRYAVAEEEDDPHTGEPGSEHRASVQWPGGTKPLAGDRQRRSPPMTARQQASFEKRFPGAARVRVV